MKPPKETLKERREPGIILTIGSAVVKAIDWGGNVDFLLSIKEKGLAVFTQAVADYAWIVVLALGLYWYFSKGTNANRKGRDSWRIAFAVGVIAFLSGFLLAASLYPSLGMLAVKGIGYPRGHMSVLLDGSRLANYSDKYNVALACEIADNTVDDLDNKSLKVSSSFNIRPDDMKIDLVTGEYRPPTGQTQYQIKCRVLLLPKQIKSEEIKTLRDVERLGGKTFSMR